MYDKSQINEISKIQARFRRGKLTEKTALKHLWRIVPDLGLCQALFILHGGYDN